MAAETGSAAAAMKERLLADSEGFSFFQAIRLLQLLDRRSGNLQSDQLRIRPRLSLAFPENDIDRIEPLPNGGYRITANFFGLYGVASPLPTFYTEDLLDEEREGGHVTRDFLDIVHYAMYPLLFEAWNKYRLEQRIIENDGQDILNLLHAFVGLGDPDLRIDLLPHSADLLRYAGLLSQRPRSVLGLRTMLADAFAPARVRIDSCVARTLPIPDDQRMRVGVQGHCLGEDAYLGSEVEDYGSNIRISLSDVPADLFHQLLPGAPGHRRLRFLTRFYLIDPLHVEVELEPRAGHAEAVRTNARRWSRLGLDSWLAPDPHSLPTGVRFDL